MTTITEFPPQFIEYPESDGLPMAESDQTRDVLMAKLRELNIDPDTL